MPPSPRVIFSFSPGRTSSPSSAPRTLDSSRPSCLQQLPVCEPGLLRRPAERDLARLILPKRSVDVPFGKRGLEQSPDDRSAVEGLLSSDALERRHELGLQAKGYLLAGHRHRHSPRRCCSIVKTTAAVAPVTGAPERRHWPGPTIDRVKRLPPDVRELFWEGLAEEPDPEAHADYIAIRVLEVGNERAVRWLLGRYGRDRLRAVVESGRLRPRQAEFWRAALADA